MLRCSFGHLLEALVGGEQGHLLLLVVCGRAGLPGGQGVQAQLGQSAHEDMQPATHTLLWPKQVQG